MDQSVQDIEWGEDPKTGRDDPTPPDTDEEEVEEVGGEAGPGAHSSVGQDDAAAKGAAELGWAGTGGSEDFGESAEEHELAVPASPEVNRQLAGEIKAAEGGKTEPAVEKAAEDAEGAGAKDAAASKPVEGEETHRSQKSSQEGEESATPATTPADTPYGSAAQAGAAVRSTLGSDDPFAPMDSTQVYEQGSEGYTHNNSGLPDGAMLDHEGDEIVPATGEEIELAEGEDPDALPEEEVEAEPELPKTLRGKTMRRITNIVDRGATAFHDYTENHTLRVRCVLIPLFCCCSPCIMLLVFYKAVRNCLRYYCRNKQKELDDLEAEAREVEARRLKAALAAGPQASKLKPVNQYAKFAKDRLARQGSAGGGDGEDLENMGHIMNRQMRKGLRGKKDEAHAGDASLSWSQRHKLKESRWKKLNPCTWPKMFKDWRAQRVKYFARVSAVLDVIADDEEFDWEDVDENGIPSKNKFLMPPGVRRRYRFFILVYWDPIVDVIDNVPLLLKAIKLFIRLLPVFGLIGACAWLGISLYRNFQYVEGRCIVEKLPTDFKTTGIIDEQVESWYVVKRFYDPMPSRHAGHVVQECKTSVPCTKMDYGESNSYDDDRCVTFQAWKLGDDLPCFYANDDYWGEEGTELYCLSLPSKMEREGFTVGIAGVINMLICVIRGVFSWHDNDLARQAKLAEREQANAEAEEAAAKLQIEQAEADAALHQAEAVNRELGIEEGDEEAADFLAVDMVAKEEGAEGLEAELINARPANR